jgi:hypothetical protein
MTWRETTTRAFRRTEHDPYDQWNSRPDVEL